MTGTGALAAGWLLVLTSVAFAAVGALLGGVIADARFLGGLAGGILGVICGFALVWRRYVVPANEEDAGRDYSKVRRFEDDDDDNW